MMTVLLLCGQPAAAAAAAPLNIPAHSHPPVVDLQLYVGWLEQQQPASQPAEQEQRNRRRDETIHHKISGLLIRIRKRVLSFQKKSGVRRTIIIEIRFSGEGPGS